MKIANYSIEELEETHAPINPSSVGKNVCRVGDIYGESDSVVFMPPKRKSEGSQKAKAKQVKHPATEEKNFPPVEKNNEAKEEQNSKKELNDNDLEIVDNYDDLFPEPFHNSSKIYSTGCLFKVETDKSVVHVDKPQAKQLKKVPKNTTKLSIWNLDSSEG